MVTRAWLQIEKVLLNYCHAKFDVPMYIKMESTSPNEFRGDLPRGVGPSNIYDPLYNSKNFCSVYRLHGTQNDRLELTVSTQKTVSKKMHRVPRYWPKCAKIEVAKPNLIILRLFGQYLGTRCVFFKTVFCVETVSSSRSF